MVEIVAKEFPFVESLPKREKSRWQRIRDHFETVSRIVAEKGMLVPVRLAGKIGGVSQQRIDQLCDTGQLERVMVDGHPFVTEISLVEWARSERKAGRPTKAEAMSKRELWRVAREFSKGR